MDIGAIRSLVERTYQALTSGDEAALERLLAPDFDGRFAEGLPVGAGFHAGSAATISDGWWAIGRAFRVRAEPEEWVPTVDGRLLVLGTYRGAARSTGRPLEATFTHLWSARGGRLTGVRQLTDTARFVAALTEDDDIA